MMYIRLLFVGLWMMLTACSPRHSVQQGSQQDSSEIQTVEGYVFEDINKNGTRDDGEEGISGIQVSNQRKVVSTDEDGFYQLPLEEGAIIFVTKPAGYEVSSDENNLPQFYYIHKPKGSPQLNYKGVDPTGSIPEPLNFGLIPSEKRNSFKAIIFGDPQPRDNDELTYFRDDVASELANSEADLTLVLGDIMFNDLSLYGRYSRIMKTVGTPVYNIFGNHDINFDAKNSRSSKETFKRHFGPTYFSFEYGDVHFIALDNIDYLGRDNNGPPYRGYLTSRQLEWIENQLEHVSEDKLVVFLSHIPLYSDNGKGMKKNTVNRSEFMDLINDRDRVLYLSAHRHRIFHDFLGENVDRSAEPMHHIALTAASGAWWDGPENEKGIPIALQRDGVPNGYHVFEFNGNRYQEQYKGAGHAYEFQMRIERPLSNLKSEDSDTSKLLVNVFNGNVKSKVEFQIDGEGSWQEMERLEKHYSPYVKEVMDGYRTPGHTSHMWRSEMPKLDKGMHTIRVRTRDMYGKVYRQTKIVEVM